MADVDLRCGDWRDVLADIGEVSSIITDPPYGSRTHEEHDHTIRPGRLRDNANRQALNYGHWHPDDVVEFVASWAPRTRGWMCGFSCSDLSPVWRTEMARAGRITFAPISCVIRAMTVRLSGDGPANWTVYLNVSRPRNRQMASWGSLNGAYVVSRDPGYVGGKPESLMRAIVRDYSRPGDLVCDPCAGAGTTAIAARALGRCFVGAELDEAVHAKATDRIAHGYQLDLITANDAAPQEQLEIAGWRG